MNKTILSVAAVLAIGAGSAQAADLPAKIYTKAPPIVAFDPWDVAFGGAIMSDYLFRGITQSNHQPSVTAYFEPRYNVTKDLQLYVGTSFESIAFANRAAAEVDIYGGIRPTFGALALDFGVWGYLYPGGQCQYGAPTDVAGNVLSAECARNVLANGNVMKKDVSFYEVYGKANYTFNDTFSLGATAFWTPNFLNTSAEGTYASAVGKVNIPSTWFGSSGIGSFVSGEFGHQWLGTTDAFYGNALFPNGVKLADYSTWNIGVGFTYKVFTLDLRYTDTDLNKGDCNAITSDFATLGNITNNSGTFVTNSNQSGVGSNWCSARFTAKLSADVTLQAIK
jgi:uncharacterized protein (TIGR02001 family)